MSEHSFAAANELDKRENVQRALAAYQEACAALRLGQYEEALQLLDLAGSMVADSPLPSHGSPNVPGVPRQPPGRVSLSTEDALAQASPAAGGWIASRLKGKQMRRFAWDVTQVLMLGLAILFVLTVVFQNFRVIGPSMEPGLKDGQYLFVNKVLYDKYNLATLSRYIPFISDGGDNPERYVFHGPERGDIIIFRSPADPGSELIKRVIGIPGDVIAIRDGVVSINDAELDETYVSVSSNDDLNEMLVPPGSYFVLGDNRSNSSDSMDWGFVPEGNIIGKAILSYWPLSELGGVGDGGIDLGFVEIPLP